MTPAVEQTIHTPRLLAVAAQTLAVGRLQLRHCRRLRRSTSATSARILHPRQSRPSELRRVQIRLLLTFAHVLLESDSLVAEPIRHLTQNRPENVATRYDSNENITHPYPHPSLRNDQYCVGRGAGALNSTHSLCRSLSSSSHCI